MNKDTVIGIVGSALLVAAMVVVFAYERANAQVADPDELTASVAQSTLSGTANVGQSDTKMDNITAPAGTNVTFKLTWTQGNGPDTLKITATPPAGSGITAKSSPNENDGSITLVVAVPMDAVGDWSVKVDFVSAQGGTLPGGIANPNAPADTSVSYSVAVSIA